jgi:hypothetical protein
LGDYFPSKILNLSLFTGILLTTETWGQGKYLKYEMWVVGHTDVRLVSGKPMVRFLPHAGAAVVPI